jgi:hypothetical protein
MVIFYVPNSVSSSSIENPTKYVLKGLNHENLSRRSGWLPIFQYIDTWAVNITPWQPLLSLIRHSKSREEEFRACCLCVFSLVSTSCKGCILFDVSPHQWRTSKYFLNVRKSQIRKFLGSFRNIKSENFLGMPQSTNFYY